MDDKFEDKIRESLNSPPDYPFEERVWRDLEGRLDQLDKGPPRSGFPFWWLPVLAAAIPLLLLFWLWGAYQQQGAELAHWQQRTSYEQVIIMDTVVRRTVVVAYDTIYHNVYEARGASEDAKTRQQLYPASSLLLGTHPSLPNLWSGKPSVNDVSLNRFFPTQTSPISLNTGPGLPGQASSEKDLLTSSTEEMTERENTNTRWNQGPSALLPFRFFFLNYSEEQVLPAIVVPTIEQRKKTLPERLAPVLPSAIKVGFGAGTFAASGLPEVEQQSNFSGALLAELSYSRHFSMVLGAEYLANTFGLKHDDDADFSGFPLLPPNTPGDELEKLQGDFRYWQIPFGIKYRMLVKRRLSPYLGAGLLAIRPTQSLLNYEYEGNSNYYLLSQDNILGRQLLLEDAWLMFGVEYYLGKNWSVLLDANAQWSFGNANNIIEKREFLKGRLGFGYAF